MARALIIGGSVGGLFAAHLLRAAGWDVLVCERHRGDLVDRGASIGTRDDLFEVLARIGIVPGQSAAVAATARICFDHSGAIVHEVPTSSVSSSWDRIYRPLRAALPDVLYRPGAVLSRHDRNGDRVAITFADGSRDEADLVVAADGIHSSLRAALLPDVVPVYAGYVAWRGVIEESEMTPAEHALLFGRMAFCLPDGELMLALGMPGRAEDTRPGHRRYYWIWFRPAEPARALPLLCTDADGHCYGTSIPPHRVRPEVLRDLRQAADEKLAPPLAAIVKRTAQPFPHGIFDVVSPRMVFGCVALLGDSAFVARPHVGAGITKAALDAQCLADRLGKAGDIAEALADYERERLAYGNALIARGRHLGAYLEARAKGEDAPAPRPETVLAEYGTAGKIG